VSGPAGVSWEDLSGRRDGCNEAYHGPAALWCDARRCALAL